jgi:hypothetical protein
MKSCESKSANIQPSMPTLAAAINFFPNRRVCSLTAKKFMAAASVGMDGWMFADLLSHDFIVCVPPLFSSFLEGRLGRDDDRLALADRLGLVAVEGAKGFSL